MLIFLTPAKNEIESLHRIEHDLDSTPRLCVDLSNGICSQSVVPRYRPMGHLSFAFDLPMVHAASVLGGVAANSRQLPD